MTNMKWGTLMDMAPALRRQIGAGLLLERRERRVKGKGPVAQADTMDVVDVLDGTGPRGPSS